MGLLGLMACCALLLMTGTAKADTIGNPIVVPGTDHVDGIACPTSTMCVATATGDDHAYVVPIDNGKPQTPKLVPAVPGGPSEPTMDLGQVACVSSTTCYSVGFVVGEGPITDQGGIVVPIVNGSPQTPDLVAGDPDDYGNDPLYGIACPSSGDCEVEGYAQGGSADNYDYAGVTFELSGGTPGTVNYDTAVTGFNGIFCDSTACDATDTGTTDGVLIPVAGGVAGSPEDVAGTISLNSATCEEATVEASNDCDIIGANSSGSDLLVPFDGGSVESGKVISGQLRGIGCASATRCEALGEDDDGEGEIVPIVDGVPGTLVVDDATEGLYTAACTTATSCFAVGIVPDGEGSDGAIVPITVGSNPGGGGHGSGGKTPHVTVTKLSAKAGGKVTVAISCTTATCAGTVVETAKLRERVGKHEKNVIVTVASRRYSIAAGKKATVSLSLNKKGRDALEKAKKLKVSLTVRLGSGTTAKVVSTHSLTLKAAKKK